MHIDTSRSRFDVAKHYSGVLALQGRVTLDQDQNEQLAIWLHQLRTSLTDVVGQAGAPRDAAGFEIARAGQTADKLADLSVSAGRMYVDGILVENAADTTYWSQPDGHLDTDVDQLPDGAYLVYLRVWEREVTVVQDPDIREVALGIHGPDTTARSQVVWQVAAFPFGNDGPGEDPVARWRANLPFQTRGPMVARARTPDDADTDVCSVSPEAMFRGRENQHYRVEVFRTGSATQPEPTARTSRRRAAAATVSADPAQFVWSRDNGSYVYPVIALAGAEVTVADLGRDRRSALDVGDLVEIVDDASIAGLGREVQPSVTRVLFTVAAVDTVNLVVTLDRDPAGEARGLGHDPDLSPLLRRWDAPAADIEEGAWLDLEDGVQVQFQGAAGGVAKYRSGDFWLAPARRTTGDLIWPQDDSGPAALPPFGIDYHYAPLALVPANPKTAPTDLRRVFNPLTG